MWAKRPALWILLALATAIIVAAALFAMDLVMEYVFAPLLEFVLRLFTGVGH
jgi:hypothetical protein